MQRVSMVLHVVSFAMIAVLFYLVVAGGSTAVAEVPEAEMAAADSLVEETVEEATVAYVNTDSVMALYQLAKELEEKLSTRTIQYQGQLEGEKKRLLNEAESFRQRVASMSQFEMEQRQKELMNKEQELMGLEEQLSVKLVQLEQEYTGSIQEKLDDYLERYTRDRSYQIILSDNRAGAVLWGHPGVNITREVISGLNEEYEAAQAQETP